MNQEEFYHPLTLPADQRYRYFLSKVRYSEAAWTLKGPDGFVLFATDETKKCKCLPFWPHPEHATAFATDMWADCRQERIDLRSFMADWLEGMARDNLKVAVFPTLLGTSIVVEPRMLIDDLVEEIRRFK